jgi:uncharacterized membrane protein YdbT with pleckstrin-like domain
MAATVSQALPGPTALHGGGLQGERRPAPVLMRYYALQSLMAGPGFPILLMVLFFRYRTLRYRFDNDGVTVRWGILFRKEITLTYARIQDIHLVSNIVERWLGLGRVQVQTASGSAAAELTVEGLLDFEQVRDELYVRMRGARGQQQPRPALLTTSQPVAGDDLAAVAAALQEAVTELRGIREAITKKAPERDNRS